MYSYQYLKEFTTSLFKAVGCPEDQAITVADVLVSAELRGIPSVAEELKKTAEKYKVGFNQS